MTHKFLCNDEEQDCSTDDPVAYLSHLDFEQTIIIADKTSVPFKGVVMIQAPKGGNFNCEDDQLLLEGAEVCLVQRFRRTNTDAAKNCVLTNSNGVYELPATFGTTGVSLSAHHLPIFDHINHLQLTCHFPFLCSLSKSKI